MDSTMVGEDELKHYDEKESDGGEVSSPALKYHEGELDESRKSGSSSTHPTAPEGNHMEEKVGEGYVQTERELKLEEDCKINNISIESTEEVRDRGSSSSSSSSSSDDESHVENKTAVVETGLVVDLVKPVETLPEVVSLVTECVKVEGNNSEVVETDPVDQVNNSIPAQETDNGIVEAVQVIDLAEPSDCYSRVTKKPSVASASLTVQKTSMKSCCGIFELFTSSDK